MAQLRVVELFDPLIERIEDYKERFDFYCTTHDIAEGKQKALFSTHIGQKMYTKLKTWVNPTPLAELNLEQIIDHLKVRTRPETVEIAERYKFFKRLQQPSESIIDYMGELRKLAKTCNFAGYLNTALRDQFVCGLRDTHIQRELLSIRDLTVATALDKGRAMEAASIELQQFRMRDGDVATHLVSRPRRSCYRCGNPKHVADSCPHKDKQCNKYGKTGHLARACKSKSEPAQKSRKAFKSKGTHVLQAGTDDKGSSDDEDDFLEPDPGLHKVRQDSRYRKLTTSLKLNGVCVKFEVDTGAELSTIPMAVYHAKLLNSTIHPSSVTLRQYDGTVLPTVGEIMVTVSHGQQVINGSFIIVENADTQLPLLGRDWLYQLRLDWTKLIRTCKRGDPRVHSVQQAVWLSKYPDVTKEELGLLKALRQRWN